MIFLSHRGNIDGQNPKKENSISYINDALNLGFNVEVDVWYDKTFWLGHDEPQYKINEAFLLNNRLWCHAKNTESLYELSKLNTIYFWHQKDDYTLVSNGILWAYPGSKLNEKCVCVLPEITTQDINLLYNSYGICSDQINYYKSYYENSYSLLRSPE
jgi:hypothetical protein